MCTNEVNEKEKSMKNGALKIVGNTEVVEELGMRAKASMASGELEEARDLLSVCTDAIELLAQDSEEPDRFTSALCTLHRVQGQIREAHAVLGKLVHLCPTE